MTPFDGSRCDARVRGGFEVTASSDCVVPMHGPMTQGGTAQLRRSAGLLIDGVRINVVSRPCQLLDFDLYRFLGAEPG